MPAPAPDEIHLWVVTPAGGAAAADALLASLSRHERHRAARMRQPGARHEFVIGRARVRHILSAYVGQPPPDLDVVTRVDDRPRLVGAPDWFDFSFSRCDGCHVCAVGRSRRIGVDVERCLAGAADRLPDDLLSAEEGAWVDAQPPPRRDDARTALWTKKEAFAKAVGGVAAPLSAVRPPLHGDGPVTLADDAPRHPGPWLVRGFEPLPGVTGAVAADGVWRLTLLPFPL